MELGADWDKRYTFRLTMEDAEIRQLLDRSTKRSETIRKMLRFAVDKMKEEQKKNEIIELLLAEVAELKDIQQKNHYELLSKLENSSVKTNESHSENEPDVTNEMMNDSANAFLSTFGVGTD